MKNFSTKFGFSITALLPAMLLGSQAPAVEAQETEPEIYNCRQCVKYTDWRGFLDFGFGYVSSDSLGYGDYTGLEEEGLYAAIDGEIHYRDLSGDYFDLYASDLGYESREIDLRSGNQGFYEIRLGWQETPRYLGYNAQTPYLGVGGDYLTLPSDWVYANTTSGMTALDSNLVPEDLKLKRKTLDVGATFSFLSEWSYRIDYQRQKKTGTRAFAGSMYYSYATITPAPVDFKTDIVDMALSWAGKRAQVEFGFLWSEFENGASSLTWENPFRAQPELSMFRAALEPDNDFHQFNIGVSYTFTPRIRMSGQASFGRLKQDEDYLPYTINPNYADLELPRPSLDGKLDIGTYNFSGKLYARLNSKLSFTARGKWDERDNKTPVDVYTPVITDLLTTIPRYNRPYSYKRQQYSADLRYRASRMIRLSGGLMQHNIDRELQAVDRTKETTGWGEVKVNPTLSTQFRFKLETSDRDNSEYVQPLDGGPVDHPLMRKYNLADRSRDRYLVEFDYMPLESFGLNLRYSQADSDYEQSEIGLNNSNDKNYSLNLNYVTSFDVNLYAFYNYDKIKADMRNSSGGSSMWDALTRDKISTIGIGFSKDISEKSSIGFDFVSSSADGNISVTTSDDEEPFPELKTDLRSAKLYFNSEINDHWGYKVFAEFEKFRADDWAVSDYGPGDINSILSLGEGTPEYNVWYVKVQASYRF
jgi:MtrB/PioB family decaheme-associated outer membrane protein